MSKDDLLDTFDIKIILNDEWANVNNKIIRIWHKIILTLLDHIVDN